MSLFMWRAIPDQSSDLFSLIDEEGERDEMTKRRCPAN